MLDGQEGIKSGGRREQGSGADGGEDDVYVNDR